MQYLDRKWLLTSGIVFAILVFVLVYHPTLFNFFIADDYAYMMWLRKALCNPALLWETFYRPIHVVYPGAVVFYRPLFTAMLFVEGTIWGINAVNFRLVNMVTEILAGLMIGLVVLALKKASLQDVTLVNRQFLAWAFLSSVFFILFPLHSEPVNWIAARMDPLVSLLSLFSLWSYILWRNSSILALYILSIISAVCAFLTKEMATALPPMILAYELLFQQPLGIKKNVSESVYSCIRYLNRAIVATLPYWLIWLLYFCLRKFILGHFIAGYPDTAASNSLPLIGWLNGLKLIFVPINASIFEGHRFIFIIWYLLLFILIALTITAVSKTERRDLRIISFLIIWFLLSLLPLYKVFPVAMSCASGSRIAYYATAPLCMLLTYGLATFCLDEGLSFITNFIALSLLCFSAIILYANNVAWAEAGHLDSQFIQELKNYHKNISGDPLIYITGLPVLTNKGIAVCTGFFEGFSRKPFMEQDLFNIKRLDADDQYTSLGFVKQAIEHDSNNIKLLYWDSKKAKLSQVEVPQKLLNTTLWEGMALKQIVSVPSFHHISEPVIRWLENGTLNVVSDKKREICTILELNLNRPCWNMDFIALAVKFNYLKNLEPFQGAAFFFQNDIAKEYTKEYFRDYFVLDCCRVPIKFTDKEQNIIFSLRNLPEWIMGGKCKSVRIVLPTNCSFEVKKIWIPEAKTLIPQVSLESTSGLPPGEIQLNTIKNTQHVKYDVRSMKGCTQTVLEVSKAYQYLQKMNPNHGNELIWLRRKADNTYGQFILNRTDFPSDQAVYKARIIATDKTGRQVGFSSDNFFIRTNF